MKAGLEDYWRRAHGFIAVPVMKALRSILRRRTTTWLEEQECEGRGEYCTPQDDETAHETFDEEDC